MLQVSATTISRSGYAHGRMHSTRRSCTTARPEPSTQKHPHERRSKFRNHLNSETEAKVRIDKAASMSA